MKTIQVFFESLNQTYTLEPLYDPPDNKLYWVIDEEQELWYASTGFPTCIMRVDREKGQSFCHSEFKVKVGRVI